MSAGSPTASRQVKPTMAAAVLVLHQSLPADRDNRPRSSPPGTARRVRTATQPISARFELVEALKGVTPLVPHVHLSRSLTGPVPSGSTGTSRRCRGCSHPHPRLRDQAASHFNNPLRRAISGVLSPPPGQTAPRGARRAASGPRAVAGPALRVRLPPDNGASRRADDANGFANDDAPAHHM